MNLKDQISDVCFKLCCRREWVKEREREKQELEDALRCNLKHNSETTKYLIMSWKMRSGKKQTHT